MLIINKFRIQFHVCRVFPGFLYPLNPSNLMFLFCFRKLAISSKSMHIVLNMSFSISALTSLFAWGLFTALNYPPSLIGCKLLGVSMHYFTLSTAAWMLILCFNVSQVNTILVIYLGLLFSAHISYGKGKYLNQTGFFFFFLQNLPRFYLYLNLRVLPIEFNPHKFSFVRYVFVEIFEVFFKK